jgi:hypothetical protein
VEGVYAWAANVAMSGSDPNQAACPECVAYFGRRNPERFPTIEEYEEATRRYPEPILAGEEDMMRLDDNAFFDEVYDAATLSRGNSRRRRRGKQTSTGQRRSRREALRSTTEE